MDPIDSLYNYWLKKRVENLKKGSRELKNYCCKVVVVVVVGVAQICIDYFTDIMC